MRAAAHEDINLITLLVTGSEPGLQARDKQGNWHDVPCQSGYITVNAGDMLARASDGYYPSTWASNLGLSGPIPLLAGLFWNLAWKKDATSRPSFPRV